MPRLLRPSHRPTRRGASAPTAIIVVLLWGALACLGGWLKSQAQGPVMSGGGNSAPPVITWRPSKKDAKYIGPQACAKCHAALVATQPATSMGSAAQTVETSGVLRSYP